MAKVFLLSSFRDPELDTHWASPYFALRKAFTGAASCDLQLVESADAADLILICPRPRNPVFPFEMFRGGVAWRHRHKCVVISTDDNPTLTHKGFYTSLRAGVHRSPWFKGGFYPLVSYADPAEAFPLDADFRYLFSFLGSFDTHPVRGRIGELAAGPWRADPASFLVKDTSPRSRQAQGALGDDETFRRDYLLALCGSKFILCPRGMCPSTLRLFETIKAGRVPVVISDEWVRPPEVPWDQFVIMVKEKDVSAIPAILAREEPAFAQRALAARRAWEQFFERDVLAATTTRWGVSLVAEARTGAHSWSHMAALWSQVVRWRFIRRGLLSELRRLISAS